jgi:hypothetical protein
MVLSFPSFATFYRSGLCWIASDEVDEECSIALVGTVGPIGHC